MFAARKIASSAVWRTLEVGGNEGISFVFFVLLTRMLAPDQFGIIALAGSLLLLGHAVLQQGIPDALIQRPRLGPEHLRTAFWAQLMLAAALCTVFALLAWPIGWLLGRPEFPLVMIAMTPILLLQSLSSTLHALLRRDLNLKASAIRTVLATLAGGIVAALVAWAGAGYWALVVQQWMVAVIGLLVLLRVAPARPWPLRRDDEALADLLTVARPIMIGQLISSAARRLDILVLGLFMADHEIGIYFLITRLVYSVQLVSQHSIGEISLVILSRLQSDLERHRQTLRQTLQVTALACATGFGLLAILSGQLIPTVFGDAWQAAGRPLQVMCLFATFGALAAVAVQILVSGHFARPAAQLTIAMALLQLAAILLAAGHGLLWLVTAIGLAQALVLLPALRETGRRFDVGAGQFLTDLWPVALAFALGLSLAVMILQGRSGWPITVGAGLIFVAVLAMAGAWIFRAFLSRLLRAQGT